ncbi:hypothetical protein [Undibacterium sp.]|uniref:hypothetical protein n=1 Tax=Undibacterium sp. TaxID=1914977 RepID=UPI00374CAF1D
MRLRTDTLDNRVFPRSGIETDFQLYSSHSTLGALYVAIDTPLRPLYFGAGRASRSKSAVFADRQAVIPQCPVQQALFTNAYSAYSSSAAVMEAYWCLYR